MFLQKPMLGTQLDRSDSLNNPVLDLLFNEGHGDRVNDLSGYGNHGTLHGFDFPPSRTSGWNPGMDGVGLNFDGIGDYIDCGANPSLNLQIMTLSALIFIPSGIDQTDWVTVIQKGLDATNEYQYALQFTDCGINTIQMALKDNDSHTFTSNSGGSVGYSLSTNTWHRVVGTYNQNDLILYVDGIERESNNVGAKTMDNTAEPVNIGRQKSGRNFKGAIARACILPRVMSPFEIMQTQIDPWGVYQQ